MRGLYLSFLLASVSQAVRLYLFPESAVLPSSLSPEQASVVLSHHFGLERFENLEAHNHLIEFGLGGQQDFIGKGPRNGLLLTLNLGGVDERDVLPSSLNPSLAISSIPAVDSLSSLVSTYLHRASHAYHTLVSSLSSPDRQGPRVLDVFSVSSPSTDLFVSELSSLSHFLESENMDDTFAAFEINGVSQIASAFGRSSQEYQTAARVIEAAIESATSKSNIHFALLTFTPEFAPLVKRQTEKPPQAPLPKPAPQEPIGSVSTCFTSVETCGNATGGCSGRGECLKATKAGRTCFVCACGKTRSEGGKTQTWAGEKCERKDISGPFVLITGTVIGLILLIGGSISLLSSVGDQALPSTLLGSAVPSKKD